MRSAHRKAHRIIWILLAFLIATGLTMALIKRKPQKQKAKAHSVIVALVEYRS